MNIYHTFELILFNVGNALSLNIGKWKIDPGSRHVDSDQSQNVIDCCLALSLHGRKVENLSLIRIRIRIRPEI